MIGVSLYRERWCLRPHGSRIEFYRRFAPRERYLADTLLEVMTQIEALEEEELASDPVLVIERFSNPHDNPFTKSAERIEGAIAVLRRASSDG